MTEAQKSIDRLTVHDTALSAVEKIRTNQSNDLVTIHLGGGALQFAEVAFEGLSTQHILAKKVTREPQGRGPHFDAYRDLLSDQYPYLAQFNLSGTASIETAHLAAELAAAYWREFPKHSEEAFVARRHLGYTALLTAGDEKTVDTLKPGTGFILPQNHDLPIVHNIVPVNPEHPGQFIKLLIPNDSAKAREFMQDDGYMSLDSLMTQALDSATVQPVKVVTRRLPGKTVFRSERRAD
jgi:hypothetical protein